MPLHSGAGAAIFSTLTFLGFAVGMWFAVRAMIRLDRRQRERLSARYGVDVEMGPRGHWRVVYDSRAPYPKSRLWLELVVFGTQMGIWMGFGFGLLACIGGVVAVGAWLSKG